MNAREILALRKGTGVRNSWYRIKNLAASDSAAGVAVAEVYLYDEIGFWGVTAQDFISDIKALKADQIELHLNSPGGEVFDGIAIMESLKQHKASVTVHIDSLAASIASVIAMAGDRIIMARNATMMIHDGSDLCMGNASDMQAMADLLDKVSSNIASVYADRAGGTTDEWRTRMRAETWYSADEAVAAGLADEVKSDSKKDEKAEAALAARNEAPVVAADAVAQVSTDDPAAAPQLPAAVVLDVEAFRNSLKEAFK